MTEKKYKYTTRIKQPQKVVNIRLIPTGGTLTERDLKSIKKDVYGASLLEKNLLVIEEISVTAANAPSGESIPDFEE